MKDLAERVAVVTGAASGLGRAMATRFASEGMRVALADIDAIGVREVEQELKGIGATVLAEQVDVSNHEDIDRLADRTFDEFGAVHLLCNNAGVTKRARTWALTLDDWTWVLNVDLWSTIYGIKAFVPRMIEQGEPGHVVNTASVTGLLPMAGLAAYSTAKSAVVGLSESLALDLVAEGSQIGVSVFCPGFVPTRIADSARNRPDELAESAPSAGIRNSATVQSTLSAEEAIDQLLDAVVTGRFWVLTHPAYREVIQRRAAGIGTDAQPFSPPVW